MTIETGTMRTDPKLRPGLLSNPLPGEILAEEFLKPMKLSQTALARAIAVPPRRINEIVLGKRAITADTDLRLARYFGMSEGFFIGLQTDYELMERKRALGDKLKAIRPRGLNCTYIRNTPNFVSGIGALSATEKHSASTRRVSAGVIMPSSHSRAVA
jgi:addiction module HigA family antidote